MDAKSANITDRASGALLRECCRALAWLVVLACILMAVAPVYGRPRPGTVPLQIRKGDVLIWDEQYLRGSPKGWKTPSDYHESFGRGGPISSGIRFGRFGLLSGRFLYTTWRPIEPLSDEVYAEGKVSVFDHHVSELVTPPFEVKLDYVTFLLSGGYAPNEACINLLVDGKVVRSATGRNDDLLEFVAFDVKAFRGKKAQIQVLDTSLAAFGYITVDCIYQSPNTKGAVRVISKPPSTANVTGARAETIAGRLTGAVAVTDGRLLVGGKVVDLTGLLLLDTGVRSVGDATAQRLELVNGDVLIGEILKLTEGELVVRHAVFGQVRVALKSVAQAVFIPGPSSKAGPGVLVHSKGNKIPGELLWIREDNVAIKCSLGTVPLPRGRVRSYVFNKATGRSADADTVVLADGSRLSGTLSLEEKNLVLKHDALGPVNLAVTDVARITRRLAGVTALADLRGRVQKQVGPIAPPEPVRVKGESDGTLRMFPHTELRYALPQSDRNRRFRAVLAPLADARATVVVSIRVQGREKSFTIRPDAQGTDIDVDLGRGGAMDIIVDSVKTIAYPCGVELRNAFIVEDGRP